jgi:hypothetical protein
MLIPSFKSGLLARCMLLALLGLTTTGCDRGPARGTVKGTVTLDGQTVDGGVITFVPANGDTQPEAATISAGEYAVTMPLGEKRVEIYWAPSAAKAPDTPTQGRAPNVHRTPTKNTPQSELKHTVEKGESRKDFSLTTK